LEEVENNTHHYISLIADAADSQLVMLSSTGVVPADVYDNLRETVRGEVFAKRQANRQACRSWLGLALLHTGCVPDRDRAVAAL
jgi:hypothetical protein